jgi:hypothetical protein
MQQQQQQRQQQESGRAGFNVVPVSCWRCDGTLQVGVADTSVAL